MTSDDVNAMVFICRGAEDREFNNLLETFSLGAEFREGRLIVVAEKKTAGGTSASASASAGKKPGGKR